MPNIFVASFYDNYGIIFTGSKYMALLAISSELLTKKIVANQCTTCNNAF